MPRTKAVAEDGRRRHPAAGGYARGDDTRARIVAAALDVFGQYGFGEASTRMLAEKAGVTLPALQYYFDNKEGLYLACAEHITQRMEMRLKALMDETAAALMQRELPRARLTDMLLDFLDRLADIFLGERELEKWTLFIIREQAQPTRAFDLIFDRVMHPVVRACAALVGRLLERPASDREVKLRTLMLIGRIVIFRPARETALRVLGWPDFAGDRLALVKKSLHAQVAAEFSVSRHAKQRGRT